MSEIATPNFHGGGEIIRAQATRILELSTRLAIAEAQRNAADERVSKLEAALKPFATFACTEFGEAIPHHLMPMRDRICEWFGPSAFEAARAALETP